MTTEINKNLSYGERMVEKVKQILLDMCPDLKIQDCQYTTDDYNFATDLKVGLYNSIKTVGVRIRNNNKRQYRIDYPNQFTTRAYTSDNGKTELHKIIDGYMDMMFYGHEQNDDIVEWNLLNMSVYRWDVFQSGSVYFEAGRNIPNCDSKGTKFYAYHIDKFRSDFVITGSLLK